MKKWAPRLALATNIAFIALASSCDTIIELFEDRPDEYMVRQVIWKTYTFLDDLASAQWPRLSTGGAGTVLSEDSNPPGGPIQTLTMTITAFETADDYDSWFSADAAFDGWAGDGSSPYMELTGTVSYANRLTVDGTRALSGSLDVDDPPEGNTIDHIDFDLTFDENRATGTVRADGQAIRLDGVFIPTE